MPQTHSKRRADSRRETRDVQALSMRVGLNVLYLVPGKTGGRETYARELIAEMLELFTSVEFIAFANREASAALREAFGEGLRIVQLPVDVASRPSWAAGELVAVPTAAAFRGVDILHSLANFGPVAGPFASVLTVHDAHRHDTAVPGSVSALRQTTIETMMRAAARKATRVIADSHAGCAEICARIGLNPSKVDVAPLGVGRSRQPGKRSVAETRSAFGLGERVTCLSVATNMPHKNLVAGIRALATMPATDRPVLALAGLGTDGPDLRDAVVAAGVTDDVRLIGYCDDDTLEDLYCASALVLLPTLYEGFGLPVLEAMTRGLAVACSDIPVLREVAGDNALYFDPHSPREIADVLGRLLDDKELRVRLATAGMKHSEQFSWRTTAQLTMRSYEQARLERR
ncbi:glycosyltransferase family 1 protein [Conexibacter sp. S30A1]|uniref:glycosyltransferase family 4 protein n=1 Tax=Conexibacter sp. S30A1 TaxID=2937800 RepID=UPI00200BFEA3|nr:glycosyltransferase family 1 protein [Conexibacter sp. S30A1]